MQNQIGIYQRMKPVFDNQGFSSDHAIPLSTITNNSQSAAYITPNETD